MSEPSSGERAVRVSAASGAYDVHVGPGVLARAGAIAPGDAARVAALVTEQVLGGGVPVGHIRVAF